MPGPEPLLPLPAPEAPQNAFWRVLRGRYTGWVVAAIAILWFYGNPRTITTERVEWKERTITTTKYVESVKTVTKYVESVSTTTKIVGGPGSKTTVYPDGHYVIEGPSTVDFTTSKTSSGEATTDSKKEGESTTDSKKEGKSEKKVEPVKSRFSIGAGPIVSLIHPLTDSKLLVDGVYTFGHLLFFDVGVGGILEAPLGTLVPEYAGIKVTLSW